jgi:hypothetical protein
MKNSKIGSSSVFLVIVFAALLLIASVLIRAAGLTAGRSYGDAVFQLAGRSVLSEYDRKLFEDYGIFGMKTDEETARKKLQYYSDASLKRNTGGITGSVWLLPCSVRDIDVDLKEYSLSDIDVFEKQMLDDIKYIFANNLKEALLEKNSESESSDSSDSSENRKINNQAVLNSLPSKGLGGSGPSISSILSNGLPSVSELISGTGDSFLTTEYILARYTAANTSVPKPAAGHERFFNKEVEYIIMGKSSDNDNYNDVKLRLRLMRFALNEITLHTDRELINQVNVTAELIGSAIPPGPWTPFIRELVIAAWCAIETENDIRLLEGGERVPLNKKEVNWAMGTGSVIAAILDYIESGIDPGEMSGIGAQARSMTEKSSAVKPRKVEGFLYVDYLRVLLFFTSREVKLLRMMDLIQLNMKINYYSDFLIHEHYTGLKYRVVMNNDTYFYDQKYRKD